jgi:pimeloyl-ACP methyl ester carboxylesterase
MKKSLTRLCDGLELVDFSKFHGKTILIDSPALKGNPLGDPTLRRNPVLVPKENVPEHGWPVVLILSGLFGNGPMSFNLKSHELNAPQIINQCAERGEAPFAVYVFCDALTYWGGSQFLNSEATGRYEDYVLQDLVSGIIEYLPVSADRENWCVMGGSSGGYGALHLASRNPERFALAAAVAPDSFFEASLIPDLYTAIGAIDKMGGIAGVRKELESGRLKKRREWHSILNVVAMGLCYAPDGPADSYFPLDPRTGVMDAEIWKKWKRHDPVVFLRERGEKTKRLKEVFLDVGTRDQFHLQYGTRQIHEVFRDLGVKCAYSEFEGTHFDIGERRVEVWKWLSAIWSRK